MCLNLQMLRPPTLCLKPFCCFSKNTQLLAYPTGPLWSGLYLPFLPHLLPPFPQPHWPPVSPLDKPNWFQRQDVCTLPLMISLVWILFPYLLESFLIIPFFLLTTLSSSAITSSMLVIYSFPSLHLPFEIVLYDYCFTICLPQGEWKHHENGHLFCLVIPCIPENSPWHTK